MKNTKAKGSSFERKIARDLSMWLTAGADPKQLIRSVLSGGWRGARQSDGWRQAGDLAPNGPKGEAFRSRYAVECKHRKKIIIDHVWTCTSDKDGLKAWWEKLNRECETAGVSPMLIFRSNGRDILVAMEQSHASLFPAPLVFDRWHMMIAPLSQLLALPPLMFNTHREQDR